MRKRLALLLTAGSLALLPATIARAEEPFTGEKIQAAGGLNYGFYVGGREDIPNAYGPGFNLRGGYTLGPRIYVGAELNYFLGGSQNQLLPTAFGTFDAEVKWKVLQFGAEVGYDIGLSPKLLLRPKLGLGYGSVAIEASAAGLTQSDSFGGVVIPIGLEGLYSLGKVFVSAEARYGFLTITAQVEDPATGQIIEDKTNANAIIIGAGAGARF